MPNYNISLNPELAEIVKTEMKRQKFANRSEFFRDLVRRHCISPHREDVFVEEVTAHDPDFQLAQRRLKNAQFRPLKDVLKSAKIS